MVESFALTGRVGTGWLFNKDCNPVRRPGGFEIRRKKRFDLLKRGIWNPPIFRLHSCLMRISNPQSLNRLGHFLTPDCKSAGTPSGLAFLASNPAERLAGLAFLILYYNPGWLFNSFSVSSLDGRVISGFTILPFGSRRMKRGIPLMR